MWRLATPVAVRLVSVVGIQPTASAMLTATQEETAAMILKTSAHKASTYIFLQ